MSLNVGHSIRDLKQCGGGSRSVSISQRRLASLRVAVGGRCPSDSSSTWRAAYAPGTTAAPAASARRPHQPGRNAYVTLIARAPAAVEGSHVNLVQGQARARVRNERPALRALVARR